MLGESHRALRFHPLSTSASPDPIQLLMSVLKGPSCDLCYPASNSLPVGLHSTALQPDGLVINIFMAFWGLFPLPAGFLFIVDLLPFQRRIGGRPQTEVCHGHLGGWGGRWDGGQGKRGHLKCSHLPRDQGAGKLENSLLHLGGLSFFLSDLPLQRAICFTYSINLLYTSNYP